jgi:hypothetical protein
MTIKYMLLWSHSHITTYAILPKDYGIIISVNDHLIGGLQKRNTVIPLKCFLALPFTSIKTKKHGYNFLYALSETANRPSKAFDNR